MIRRSTYSGFTLLELMVAVVIIGILAGIAVPSYTNMLSKSRRNEGIGDLYTVMEQQERFFLNNTAYTENLGKDGLGYNLDDGAVLSPKGHYKIAAGVCQKTDGGNRSNVNSCVKLTATPIRGSDPTFWLQSDGQKSENMP